ncbi:MAG: hypothetical protein ACR2PL_13335, partial [Dehalococcoidia bacterium]
DLHPAMHPAAVQLGATAGTRFNGMPDLLVHLGRPLPSPVMRRISLGAGLLLPLALGLLTRPRPWQRLWRTAAPSPLILVLQGCYLLAQQGILLLQADDDLVLIVHELPQFGILPLQDHDSLVLAGQSGVQPCHLLLQGFLTGAFLRQEHLERGGIQ